MCWQLLVEDKMLFASVISAGRVGLSFFPKVGDIDPGVRDLVKEVELSKKSCG